LITYSNASKIKLLHIPKNVLEDYGAVSPEVAKAMAEGVRILSETTFGLATTGIAGPEGIGTSKVSARDLPVGTLFLAIAEKGRPTLVWREFFAVERLAFKEKAVEVLLYKLSLILKKLLK
jgi:PncC family amidohydrolase